MTDDQLKPWHIYKLARPLYDRVDVVKEGMCSEAYIKLIKSKGGIEMNLEAILANMVPEHATLVREAVAKAKQDGFLEGETKGKEDMKSEVEKAVEDKDKAEKDLEGMKEEVKKSKEEKEATQTEEEILKSASPEVRAVIEKARNQAAAADTALKIIREEKDAKAVSDSVQILKSLPVGEDVITDVLKSAKKVSDEHFAKVFEVLKTAGDAVAKSVLGEVGSAAEGGSTDRDTTWAAIDAKAVEIAKSRNLSKAKAVEAAITENPLLYKQYVESV